MANVQFTENLTEEQLDAMAGSETLRYQATSFGLTRNNKVIMKTLMLGQFAKQVYFIFFYISPRTWIVDYLDRIRHN